MLYYSKQCLLGIYFIAWKMFAKKIYVKKIRANKRCKDHAYVFAIAIAIKKTRNKKFLHVRSVET